MESSGAYVRAPDQDAMKAIAVEVFDEGVGSVWFEGDTVAAVVNGKCSRHLERGRG